MENEIRTLTKAFNSVSLDINQIVQDQVININASVSELYKVIFDDLIIAAYTN